MSKEDAPVSLAHRILHLFDQPDLATRMGISGQKRMAEQFSWQGRVLAYDAPYKTLLFARQPRIRFEYSQQ